MTIHENLEEYRKRARRAGISVIEIEGCSTGDFFEIKRQEKQEYVLIYSGRLPVSVRQLLFLRGYYRILNFHGIKWNFQKIVDDICYKHRELFRYKIDDQTQNSLTKNIYHTRDIVVQTAMELETNTKLFPLKRDRIELPNILLKVFKCKELPERCFNKSLSFSMPEVEEKDYKDIKEFHKSPSNNAIKRWMIFPEDRDYPTNQNWLEYFELLIVDMIEHGMISVINESNTRNNSLNSLMVDHETKEIPFQSPKDEIKTELFNFDISRSSNAGAHQECNRDIALQEACDLIKKEIKEKILKKKNRRLFSDTLYYANRRGSSGVIIPRRTYEPKKIYGDVIFLVDVSGSMNTILIGSIISTLRQCRSIIGSHSRVILWNTVLIGDYLLREEIPPLVGGGTRIADGFKYLKHYVRKNSKIIILSDMEDDLAAWKDELSQIFCKKYMFRAHSYAPVFCKELFDGFVMLPIV
jgi:hypothetical protein